jgi:hypothetical protein
MRTIFFLSLAIAGLGALSACGSTTVADGATTTSGTTGAGGGSTSTSTTATGAGGATSTSAGGSGGATTTSAGGAGGGTTTSAGGAGGAGGCIGSITVAIDGAAPVTLDHPCPGLTDSDVATSAFGYKYAGGPVGAPYGTRIAGCLMSAAGAEGLVLDVDSAMNAGAYTKGLATFTDANGATWGVGGDPFDVTISTYGDVGAAIDGSFTLMVTHGGNAAHGLVGTFHVCHAPDLLAP